MRQFVPRLPGGSRGSIVARRGTAGSRSTTTSATAIRRCCAGSRASSPTGWAPSCSRSASRTEPSSASSSSSTAASWTSTCRCRSSTGRCRPATSSRWRRTRASSRGSPAPIRQPCARRRGTRPRPASCRRGRAARHAGGGDRHRGRRPRLGRRARHPGLRPRGAVVKVVLLHALPLDERMWEPQLETFLGVRRRRSAALRPRPDDGRVGRLAPGRARRRPRARRRVDGRLLRAGDRARCAPARSRSRPHRLACRRRHAGAPGGAGGHHRADPTRRGGGALGVDAPEALPGRRRAGARRGRALDRARAAARRARPGRRGDSRQARLDGGARRARREDARGDRRRRPVRPRRRGGSARGPGAFRLRPPPEACNAHPSSTISSPRGCPSGRGDARRARAAARRSGAEPSSTSARRPSSPAWRGYPCDPRPGAHRGRAARRPPGVARPAGDGASRGGIGLPEGAEIVANCCHPGSRSGLGRAPTSGRLIARGPTRRRGTSGRATSRCLRSPRRRRRQRPRSARFEAARRARRRYTSGTEALPRVRTGSDTEPRCGASRKRALCNRSFKRPLRLCGTCPVSDTVTNVPRAKPNEAAGR